MQSALGGRKRLPHVGECIVADGRLPCQYQPLRGLTVPSRGAGPSTWFLGVEERAAFLAGRVAPPKRPVANVSRSGHDDLPRGPLIQSLVVGRQNTTGSKQGQGEFLGV
jgi:hypothetical protein